MVRWREGDRKLCLHFALPEALLDISFADFVHAGDIGAWHRIDPLPFLIASEVLMDERGIASKGFPW
ncbi:Uncharacterised protein [Mycobacteroides abscessus subsp. abscessus]|nr:Uncharacterised protein [Mycobacteroides abscessus subsp. abscessus]